METEKENTYLDAAMHVIDNDPYCKGMYGYLKNNRLWFERFRAFLKGKKTLPLLYDPFFKKIFSPVEHRERLSELVSCLLGQQVTVLEVYPAEDSQFIGIFVIMDMVVRMSDGSIANIEIQKVPYDFPAERISCYSADLVLRQYKMLTGSKNEIESENDSDDGDDVGEEVSYKSMRKVHTIILFEKSSANLQSEFDEKFYFHVGKTVFNTGIKINLLQDFLLISLDTFKKYRYSDIITGRTNVTEYDCDKTQYSDGISDKMVSDRIKYMSLFVAETPEEIDRLVALFPDLESVRHDINEYLVRPKEVLNMFTEALRILDRNTANLMVDRLKEEVDSLKGENDSLKDENTRLKEEIENLKKNSK